MKYLKLGIAPLCSLWFSYLSLANWLARYPVSRGEAGVCRFGGTHWLFDPTSPGVGQNWSFSRRLLSPRLYKTRRGETRWAGRGFGPLVKPTTLMWLNLRDDIFKGGRELTVGRLNLIERANRELTAGDDQTMQRRRGGIVD